MIISTSPLWVKTGKSFWGMYEDPPACERPLPWRRLCRDDETTEEGPRRARSVEYEGCDTIAVVVLVLVHHDY